MQVVSTLSGPVAQALNQAQQQLETTLVDFSGQLLAQQQQLL